MSKLIPRLKSVGLNLIRYKQATISVTWQSSSKFHSGMITWTTIYYWYPNRAHSPWIHWWSYHPGTIIDTWYSGTAWGPPWCSCSTLRPTPHSSPQDCAPSPDVHFTHITFTWSSSLLTWFHCSLPVSGECPFLVGGFATLLFATWKSAPKQSSGEKANLSQFCPKFSFSHQSFIYILEGDHNPASWLVEVDHLKWWLMAFCNSWNIVHLNFLKIIEIGSTPYRYSARRSFFNQVFSEHPIQ